MSDLVTFLRARLDEDEAAARAAFWNDGPGERWTAASTPHGAPYGYDDRWYLVDDQQDGVVTNVDPQAADAVGVAAHIARHDPARVLAEVAAKRALLDMHRQVDGMGYSPSNPREGSYGRMDSVCTTCGTADEYGTPWPCSTLRHLATVYAEHPDYDEAWRP